MIAAVESPPNLLSHHWAQLQASGISATMAEKAKLRSETDHQVLAFMINARKWPGKNGAGLVIPYLDRNGDEVMRRVRPDNPPLIGGKPAKYLSPKKAPIRIYFPPGVLAALDNPLQPLVITEGEKKALCATQNGFPCIGLSGVRCFNKKKASALVPDLEQLNLSGRKVFIAYDSDIATNDKVQEAESSLAAMLQTRGAVVKVVRIPATGDSKQGIDDFIVANDAAAFAKLLELAGDPEPVDPDSQKESASDLDPAREAAAYLAKHSRDGVSRLRYWRGTYVGWFSGKYTELAATEIRCDLIRVLNERFIRLTSGVTTNVVDQIKALTLLPSTVQQPAWLNRQPSDPPASGCVSAKNGIVSLPDLVSGNAAVIAPTPRFFTSTALDYEIHSTAPPPARWLTFLSELWPEDQQSIDLLQEWFGYVLSADTSQQKILMMIGPKRSGKGTIARVLRAMIGSENVASPTLFSLSLQFGLASLIGKSLAIISDARLSGRTDTAVAIERLLQTSGEDAQPIERKYMETISCKLPTRVMIMTNELPRLPDTSGAMSSRIVMLTMTQSFYGHEDHQLGSKLLAELPGIVLWAAAGWKRLNDRGCFLQPDSALAAIDELQYLTSPVGAFVNEMCWTGPNYQEKAKDLYDAWCVWCKSQSSRKPGTLQRFGRDLATCVGLTRSQPRDGNEGRSRVYGGIGLKSSYPDV